MSEMIERVARALYNHRPYDRTWENLCPTEQEIFASRARAAIEAMREPTEAMMESGLETGAFENGVFHATKREPGSVYRAMIDEALK